MKVIVLLALFAFAYAQDVVDLDSPVVGEEQWPENDDTNGGFLAGFVYSNVESGSCYFNLPEPAVLFHVLNGHIVTGDGTNPVEGRYTVAAPAGWEMENGTLRVLVYCGRGALFNATDVEFSCDPLDVAELSVYSFPQNDEVKEASSNVYYRPGYHQGDALTITLPSPVARFNITGADSRWEITSSDDGLTHVVTGFVNELGVDEQKEVHFSLDYLVTDEDNPRENWFSAGQITVAVTTVEEEEEDVVV